MYLVYYMKILKQSMMDKNIDDKEAVELKKLYDHHLDKRREMMENFQFNVENVFGDILGKKGISPEQITKFNNF